MKLSRNSASVIVTSAEADPVGSVMTSMPSPWSIDESSSIAVGEERAAETS
jgi:hypothetical protein